MHHVNVASKFTICGFVPLNYHKYRYRCAPECLNYYFMYQQNVSAIILTWAHCSQKRPTVPRTDGPLAHASPRPSKSLM